MLLNAQALFKKFEKPLLILAGSATLTAVLLNLDFSLLEANLYDLRTSRGLQFKADPNIVLVTVDDATTKALDEFSPLPLDLHARFMESLDKLQPRAVGYLVDLNRVNQANPDLFHKEWGTRFVQAAQRMQSRGTVVLLGTPYDVTGEVLPPFPLSSLPHSIALIHKDGNVFAEDKITRRAVSYLNERPVFHLDLAQRLGSVEQGYQPRGSFVVPEVEGSYFFFRYHGNTALQGKSGELPYRRISFLDILQGTVSPESIRGKILLVGTLSKDDSSDFAFTPYSKASFANPKLVVHANILDSVLHDESIIRAPNWLNWLATFAVTTIVIGWVMGLTPLYGVFSTLALAAAFMVFGQILFQLKGIWLRGSQPLVGTFVAYYLVVPYRLIREYKKRWDYQRKNELLTQVEELKTNFLSLVTHDLKTPVARIQGLAEVILRKSDHLLERDKETLNHIVRSTEELNRFISSILELSKLESTQLRLKLESKDVNQIIERLLEGFKAQARHKKIMLTATLEPLFPVRIDVDLISKVLSNLLDNALEYSPAASEVSVESRELNGFIEIAISDQGIGMTEEERRSLFTRFYRVKNDATTQISGTGLGLYLTKYFIEAHHGRVEVQSEKGKGSKFIVSLPLQLPASATEVLSKPGLTQRLGILAPKREKENVNV